MGNRFFPNIALANALGYNGQSIRGLGRNADLDIGTGYEDIWTTGGSKTWSTTAAAIEVVSTSANDAAAGTGARTILIEGIGADYLPLSETITMNGATIVAGNAAKLYLDVWRASVVTTGSGLVNAGTITVRYPAGSTLTTIPVHATAGGMSVSQNTHYIIPADKIGLIYAVYISISGTAKSDIVFWTQLDNSGFTPTAPKKVLTMYSVVTGFRIFSQEVPLYLPPRTKLWFSANTDTDNTEIMVGYDLAVVNL